jgi:hypothetical protein
VNKTKYKELTNYDLSVRTLYALKLNGITTISHLLEKSESDLIRLRNFGRKSLKEIREFLSFNDTTLKADKPEVEREWRELHKTKHLEKNMTSHTEGKIVKSVKVYTNGYVRYRGPQGQTHTERRYTTIIKFTDNSAIECYGKASGKLLYSDIPGTDKRNNGNNKIN